MLPVCLHCAAPAGADARYCGSCGTRLRISCPVCDAWLDSGLAYCSSCGTRLADSGPATVELERRTVTVLFADLVGFTSLAELLDAEEVRGLQTAFFDEVREVADRHGGTVEKYIGDAVMMVFGVPRARPNDTYRAVRTGLELHPAVSGRLGARRDLMLRVGIATGEAVVDLEVLRSRARALVSGDVVNVAARLQQAAWPGGVLVAEATSERTGDWVRYGPRRQVRVAGKRLPVAVRVAEGLSSRGDRVDGSPAVFVGREEILGRLRSHVQAVSDLRQPGRLVLVGEAGIGKSGICDELRRRCLDGTGPLPPLRWRIGTCRADGRSVGFGAVAEILRTEVGALDTDGPELLRSRLHAAATAAVGPAEAGLVTDTLGVFLGLDAGGLGRPEQVSVCRRFFVAMAEEAPTVLMVEDAHLADDGFLDFLDGLLDAARDAPLLLLLAGRTELLQRRPQWADRPVPGGVVVVPPLPDSDIGRLVDSLAPELDGDVRTGLVRQADGIPLFAREYVALLHQPRDATADPVPVPASLRELINSRIDLLRPPERSALTTAAILGPRFTPAAVAYVADRPLEDVLGSLATLRGWELLSTATPDDGTDTPEAGRRVAFQHELVAEVAYQRMARTRLIELHRRAAGWYGGGSRSASRLENAARHLSRALTISEETSTATDAMRAETFLALVAATNHACSVTALAAAQELAEQALAIPVPAGHAETTLRLRLTLLWMRFRNDSHAFLAYQGLGDLTALADELEQAGLAEDAAGACSLLGEVEWFQGRRRESLAQHARAVSVVAAYPSSPARVAALVELSRSEMMCLEHSSAIAHAEQAISSAATLGLVHLEADARVTAATARYHAALPDGLSALEEARGFCAQHDPAVLRRATDNLGDALYEEGDLRRAIRLHDASTRTARTSGTILTHGAAIAAIRAYDHADWDGVLLACDDFFRDVAPSDEHWGFQLRALSSWIRFLRGGDPGDRLDGLVARAVRTGFPQVQRTVLSHAALYVGSSGDLARAQQMMDQLARTWSPTPSVASRDWLPAAAITCAHVGAARSERLHAWLSTRRQTPWVAAAGQVLTAGMSSGADLARQAVCFGKAAEIYHGIGAQSDAVLCDLAAGRRLRLLGDPATAEPYAQRTLNFVRRNRAERLVELLDAPLLVPPA